MGEEIVSEHTKGLQALFRNDQSVGAAGQAELSCNQRSSLSGQIFAGLSAATTLSGLDHGSATDVVQLMLAAAEAKGDAPCAIESPSSSKD